jgi:microcystin degradation protein MlrC
MADRADFRGALIGHALPGGIVDRASYDALADEIVERLGAMGPVDGLWYDIHGAMVVEGLDDAETTLLERIRAVIGPDVVVSASMDLHGNVSRGLAHQCDLITCYRLAPHEDALETKERAVRNLVDVLTTRPVGAQRPVKAWIPIPVLLTVAVGVLGAFGGLLISGLSLDLYAQIGMVDIVDLYGVHSLRSCFGSG